MASRRPHKQKESARFAPRYDKKGLRKVNLALIVIVLVAFFILNLAYFGMLTSALNSEHLRIMELGADALARRFELLAEENANVRDGNRVLHEEIQRLSQTTKADIWIVHDNGEILMATHIPPSLIKAHPRSATTGRVVLPDRYASSKYLSQPIVLRGGQFMGLFSEEGGSWLSQVRPVYNHMGTQVATIQLHEKINYREYFDAYFIRSVAVTSISGIIVAILFVVIINRQISYPLSELSKTATRIARGDLSARVELPPYFTVEGGRLLPTDSLGALVETFNSMVDHLDHDAQEQRSFVAAISHDLRTPLTSILGFVTGMADGTIPPELHEHYLGIVKQEALHMRALVEDMSLAVLVDQPRELNVEVFSIRELIQEVVEGLKPQIDEKRITIQTDLAADRKQEAIQIKGDRKGLTRVLVNLLNNAVKFTPDEGIIAIMTQESPSDSKLIELRIEDSGPGIAPEDRAAIFDRFYKVDHSRTGKAGSGLGLYIVKSILGDHGQDIYVEDSSLGGAAFVFTLPRA